LPSSSMQIVMHNCFVVLGRAITFIVWNFCLDLY
jgi:hypothetical protein